MATKYPDLSRYPIVAVDVEATSLDWWTDSMFSFGVATPDWSGYFDIRHDPKAIDWAKDNFPRIKRLTNHNIKRDALWLRMKGIMLPLERADDTCVRASLINENLYEYNLDAIGRKYLGKGKEEPWAELAKLFGGKPTLNAQIKNLPNAPEALAAKYCIGDAKLALELCLWQDGEIARQGIEKIMALEKRLLPHLANDEWHGLNVDLDATDQAIEVVTKEIAAAQKQIDSVAGFVLNVNSTHDMHKFFKPHQDANGNWWLPDGTLCESTGGGKASLSAKTLRRSKDPRALQVTSLRSIIKLKSTFLEGHILGHQHNGIVHPTYNQAKTDTGSGAGPGRMSAEDPAMQQIPKRNKKISQIVRRIFVPDKGCEWGSYDWSQMEFRLFAHFGKVKPIIDIFAKDPDIDFHQLTADITGMPRSRTATSGPANAKEVNLAMVMGMSAGRFAKEAGLPYTSEVKDFHGRKKEMLSAGKEAQAIVDNYLSKVPGIADYQRSVVNVGKSRGYVITPGGRHIHVTRDTAYKLKSTLLQGSAADIIKHMMCELHDYLATRPGTRYLLSVHDDNNISVPKRDIKTRNEVRRILEDFGPDSAFNLRVPIRVDPKRRGKEYGANWWEASKEPCKGHGLGYTGYKCETCAD